MKSGYTFWQKVRRRLGVPAGADVSTDIAAISTKIGTPADTDVSTDIANLDTLIDGVSSSVTTIDTLHDVPTANATANAQMRDVIGNKTDTAVTTSGTDKSIVAYIKGALNLLNTSLTAGYASGSLEASANTVIPAGRIITNFWFENTLAMQTKDADGTWVNISTANGVNNIVVACDGTNVRILETSGFATRKYAYTYYTRA